VSNLALPRVIKGFAANNLVRNLDKKNMMKLITQNSSQSTLHIGYKEKYLEERVNSNFLVYKLIAT